jgi:predicted small integral membrane protein
MEVHAHAHTARKKWTHYFWEFLMLFLAVFCGFLAEYQLEHKIEKDREKIYMKAMVEDLKKDTANINTAVAGNRIFINGLDTLLDLLSNPQQDINYQRKVFIYSLKNTYWYMPIQFSELTLSQLKYSGGFRLVKNREVSNSILQYDQGVDACKYNYGLLLHYYHIYEVTNKELFNMSLARKAFKAIEKDFRTVFLPDNEFEKLVDEGTYLDDTNPGLLSRYHDDIMYYQTTISNLTNIIANQKSSADSLIQLIRKKYRIKD